MREKRPGVWELRAFLGRDTRRQGPSPQRHLRGCADVFTTDPTGATPPHPDAMTTAFGRTRKKAGVASDVHLHSLRHFQSTQLDAVISEAQKQARMGWATVQMARHYTGVVTGEDRRAADHIGELLDPPQLAASADG